MSTLQALRELRELGVPVFTTADARARLGGTVASASKTLARLAAAGLATRVTQGLWTLDDKLDPMLLPEHLTSPAPSYVSLQTALYRRGAIDQIPAVIYAVSLARPRVIDTPFGVFSIHRIAPEIFGGFDVEPGGMKLATLEKALVDFAYLSGTRTRLFAALPELELPKDFDVALVRSWLRRIPTPRLRALAEGRLREWLAPLRPPPP